MNLLTTVEYRLARIAAVSSVMGILMGCSGGGNASNLSTAQSSTIALSPAVIATQTGTSVPFVANLTGKSAEGGYALAVQETNGGAIDGTTYYVPPVPGVYHVVATSALDASVTGTAVVTVTPGPVDPTDALGFVILGTNYVAGGSYQLMLVKASGSAAAASGLPAVDFSVVEPSGGTLSPSVKNPDLGAQYQAPATPGTYTLKCTLRSDPSVSSTQTIKVLEAAPQS